jgi:phosphate-selective porin
MVPVRPCVRVKVRTRYARPGLSPGSNDNKELRPTMRTTRAMIIPAVLATLLASAPASALPEVDDLPLDTADGDAGEAVAEETVAASEPQVEKPAVDAEIRVAPTPAPPPPPAPPPESKKPAEASGPEPLAGFSDGTAFLRSADNFFVLFPSGRLQMDTYFYKSEDAVPTNSIILKRVRAELSGWIGPMFFFNLAGDFAVGPPPGANPVAPTNLSTTDDYGAFAPFGNLAILQIGQYNAPFTLENRTSDKYTDFIERSVAVRAFGIPTSKELGMMVHGLLPKSVAYYSLGLFNGDGQNFRNVDNSFDVMGRAWLSLAPLSLEPVLTVRAGGSLWMGKRRDGLPIASQSTEAGFSFWKGSWTGPMPAMVPLELHQDGILRAFAAELSVNVLHKYGLRFEWIQKTQEFLVADVSKAGTLKKVGDGELSGGAGYVQLWWWLIGDDLIIGEPGLDLPSRLKKFGTAKPRQGLMATVRFEYLTEDVWEDGPTTRMALGSKVLGTTKLAGFTAGLNYWWSKRVRASVNYGIYSLSGNAKIVTTLPSDREQELLFRLGFAL